MTWQTVWQHLTGFRIPPRSQPSAGAAGAPAADPLPIPLGKQRRGYRDKMLRPLQDYEDKVLPLPDGRVVVVHDGDQAQVYGALPARPGDYADKACRE